MGALFRHKSIQLEAHYFDVFGTQSHEQICVSSPRARRRRQPQGKNQLLNQHKLSSNTYWEFNALQPFSVAWWTAIRAEVSINYRVNFRGIVISESFMKKATLLSRSAESLLDTTDSAKKLPFNWNEILNVIDGILPATMRFISETMLMNPELSPVFLDGRAPLLSQFRFGEKGKFFSSFSKLKLNDFDENSKAVAQILMFIRLFMDHCYRYSSHFSNVKLEVCLNHIELRDPWRMSPLILNPSGEASACNTSLTFKVDLDLHKHMKSESANPSKQGKPSAIPIDEFVRFFNSKSAFFSHI